MMKRIIVWGVVVGVLFVATSFSWAMDVKWGGDYRLRGFYIDNLTDGDKNVQDSAAYYSSRFMLTTVAKEDGVSGVVTLLAGSTNATGNRLLGATPFGPEGPSTTSVDLLEAYLKADFKTWDLTAGRAGLKFGNGVILDDWVDGIWANFGLGGATLTVGTAKLVELTDPSAVGIGNGVSGGGTGDDADLYFVNAGLGPMGMASGTNLFLAYLNDRSAGLGGVVVGGKEATVGIIGVATDLDLNGLKLKAELDYLNGTAKPAVGSDIDIEGYNVVLGAKLQAGAIPLGVDLIYTSGQDNSSATEANMNGLSGNYPVGIIITNSGARSLGVTDGTCLSPNGAAAYGGGSPACVGGDGLTALKVSTGITHDPHVVDLAAIWARASEDPDGAGPADESIGVELDATLTWTLTKRLNWLAGVGYLVAGDYVKSAPANTGASDNLTVLVTQLSYTF
jgi:hypothetical protein